MHKTCLKMHLIFVCKYRKNLLVKLGESVNGIFLNIQEGRDFRILVMEVDVDHIHFLIEYEPTVSVTQIVRCLKQESTKLLWGSFSPYLSKCFWREHTFWSDGYFASSVGDVSAETVRKYIESQG
jgi:putative transposase